MQFMHRTAIQRAEILIQQSNLEIISRSLALCLIRWLPYHQAFPE
jgi:hypothetical protein